MQQKQSLTLVVGADGFIGSALMVYLPQTGQCVLGTTRRRARVDETRVYLDLADDVDSWQLPSSVETAVICAGVSSREDCQRDPAASARVNVDGVSALAGKLVGNGAFVVFLSSDKVFDGTTPQRLPDEPVSPVTEYGRLQAEVERRFGRWGDSTAVVRMNKVLGPNYALFAAWKTALNSGEIIRPFSDVRFSPIPLSCAIQALSLVSNRRLPGITQVAGAYDISYAEAAYIGEKTLAAGPGLVQPIAASDSGYHFEPAIAHTTLNIDRMRHQLGIDPPDVRHTIETAFTDPRALSEVVT